ncbi:kinase-like domain-containing protein, partial [Tribonema minus]
VHRGNWVLGSQIGRGAFGQVHMGHNQVTGELIAVRRLCLVSDEKRAATSQLINEIQLMQRCHHPNIVGYLGAELHTSWVCILQEWVAGGSITSMLASFGAFPQPVTHCYARQLLQGVMYLHSCGIVHRDLKGDNVLISASGVVKIADFGTSKQLFDLQDNSAQLQGTPYFMAPEVLQRQPHGMAVDIWAFACVVLQMLTGDMPWSLALGTQKTVTQLLQIMQSERIPPLPPDLDLSLRMALVACFSWDSVGRPTAKSLLHSGYFS